MGTPTILIARTDADAADLITDDIDPVDAPFITGERTQRDSTARMQVLTKQLQEALLMRHMPTLFGVRLLNLI